MLFLDRGTPASVLGYWKAMIVLESLAWLTATGGICYLEYLLIANLVAGTSSSATGIASQLGV